MYEHISAHFQPLFFAFAAKSTIADVTGSEQDTFPVALSYRFLDAPIHKSMSRPF